MTTDGNVTNDGAVVETGSGDGAGGDSGGVSGGDSGDAGVTGDGRRWRLRVPLAGFHRRLLLRLRPRDDSPLGVEQRPDYVGGERDGRYDPPPHGSERLRRVQLGARRFLRRHIASLDTSSPALPAVSTTSSTCTWRRTTPSTTPRSGSRSRSSARRRRRASSLSNWCSRGSARAQPDFHRDRWGAADAVPTTVGAVATGTWVQVELLLDCRTANWTATIYLDGVSKLDIQTAITPATRTSRLTLASSGCSPSRRRTRSRSTT